MARDRTHFDFFGFDMSTSPKARASEEEPPPTMRPDSSPQPPGFRSSCSGEVGCRSAPVVHGYISSDAEQSPSAVSPRRAGGSAERNT